jgi:hypothetical protein
MELHVAGNVLYMSIELPYLIIFIVIMVVITLLRRR